MAAGPVPAVQNTAQSSKSNAPLLRTWQRLFGSFNKWLREWALIDLLAFGGGTISTTCYAIYRQAHPEERTWAVELWPGYRSPYSAPG